MHLEHVRRAAHDQFHGLQVVIIQPVDGPETGAQRRKRVDGQVVERHHLDRFLGCQNDRRQHEERKGHAAGGSEDVIPPVTLVEFRALERVVAGELAGVDDDLRLARDGLPVVAEPLQ